MLNNQRRFVEIEEQLIWLSQKKDFHSPLSPRPSESKSFSHSNHTTEKRQLNFWE